MSRYNNIDEYLKVISDSDNRNKFSDVINWIKKEFPNLTLEIKWNQPMFINEGTHIISFSVSKNHFSVSPEFIGMQTFSKAISDAGYSQSKMLFRIKYSDNINYQLLKDIINFQIEDKKDLKTFWRK